MLYVGTMIGLFGNIMLNIYMAYALTSLGLKTLLSYFLLNTFLINYVFMPCGFLALRKIPHSIFFPCVILLGIIITLSSLFWTAQLGIIHFSLIFSCSAAPFWLLFHSCMLAFTSRDNVGNETSMAHLSITLGAVFGSIAAGIFLSLGTDRETMIYTGAGLLALACLFIFVFCEKRGLLSETPEKETLRFKLSLFTEPQRAFATMADAFHAVSTEILWPVWIKLIGAGGLAAGLLYAFTVTMKLLLSPLTGYLTNRQTTLEMKYGALFKLAGWLPWIISLHPLTSLFSSVLFAAGSHLFKVGIESRWYLAKSYTHMACREVIHGTGRIITYLALVPILFYAPQFFIALGIILSALAYLAAYSLTQSRLTPVPVSVGKV